MDRVADMDIVEKYKAAIQLVHRLTKIVAPDQLSSLLQEHMSTCLVQSDACVVCDCLSSAIDQAREDGRGLRMAIEWIGHHYGSGANCKIGALSGSVTWSMMKGEKFKGSFAGLRLKGSFEDLEQAKKAVEEVARKVLTEALVALGEKS